MMNKIETERLILREWLDKDLDAFAQINQDPKVIEFLPAALTIEETAEWIKRIQYEFREQGFGLWAVELKTTGELIGYVGLNIPRFKSHFTPCVEIGWRIGSAHWGKGYATEAAREVINHGFERLGLKEIVSFTVPANIRSIRVMTKIGMTHAPHDDFMHPMLPADHKLARHVLYKIKRLKTTSI